MPQANIHASFSHVASEVRQPVRTGPICGYQVNPGPHQPQYPMPQMYPHFVEGFMPPVAPYLMPYNPRVLRPSQVQKWVGKKFGGNGDPYNHVALFSQVIRAEQVTDFRIQYEGFGLTLEGKALTWFNNWTILASFG